jgi:hypothetical protein
MFAKRAEQNYNSPKANLSWDEQNKIVISLMILAGTSILSAIVIFILVLNNRALSLKEKIYVQQTDGTTQIAQEFERYHREAKQIRETLLDWLSFTFEWDNRIPGSKETDPGYPITNSTKVTSKAYAASYLLAPGFRQAFLKDLAKIIPEGVFSGRVNSHVIVQFISEPREINTNPGKYQIDVIATRVDTYEGREQQVYIRKTFTLQAIEPYKLALKKQEPSAFRQQIALLLRNGLMITNITDYSP